MHRVWLLLGAICVIDSNSLFLSPITRDVTASFEGRSAEEVTLASALYGGGTAVSARALAPQADRVGLGRALIWSLGALGLVLFPSAMALSVW